LNDALRVAAISVIAGKSRDDPNPPGTIVMHSPPPKKWQGMEIIGFLLSHGADPNDRSMDRPSILFEATNRKVIETLQSHGGSLSRAEKLLMDIRNSDLKAAELLLKDPSFDPYQLPKLA